MQRRPGVRAQPDGIACVSRNLGFEQYDVKHCLFVERGAVSVEEHQLRRVRKLDFQTP
jgi:hypothetical protein